MSSRAGAWSREAVMAARESIEDIKQRAGRVSRALAKLYPERAHQP